MNTYTVKKHHKPAAAPKKAIARRLFTETKLVPEKPRLSARAVSGRWVHLPKKHKQGVEVADDVMVLDKHNRRIPPPDYTVRPIDQLQRAQKRKQEQEKGGR